MCEPTYFGVDYSINPWMTPADWQNEHAERAKAQWGVLENTLRSTGAEITLVKAQPGLPDLVFTANAGVIHNGTAIPARFAHKERAGEEIHFTHLFQQLYADGEVDRVAMLPENITFEGAGDCIWDPRRQFFWLGYGFRSDLEAGAAVQAIMDAETHSLHLVDPRFYHLDTALCPLPDGSVIYYPGAFSGCGLGLIRSLVAPHERIELTEEDAASFAANAICMDDGTIIMSSCSEPLHAELQDRGFSQICVPLTEFIKSGGSAACLHLRADR
jgi:N-dimethylarginine dimethylaminohydrolase